MRAKEAGGTGGTIPQSHHLTILRAAASMGVDGISGESFLPRDNQPSSDVTATGAAA